MFQCVNCEKYLYSKGAYRIHVIKCQAESIQAHSPMDTAQQDLPTIYSNFGANESKSLNIVTDLCIELKGKLRVSKVLINTVVSKVQDLLEECGSDVSLNHLSSNYSRKKHYTKLGV